MSAIDHKLLFFAFVLSQWTYCVFGWYTFHSKNKQTKKSFLLTFEHHSLFYGPEAHSLVPLSASKKDSRDKNQAKHLIFYGVEGGSHNWICGLRLVSRMRRMKGDVKDYSNRVVSLQGHVNCLSEFSW